MNKLACVCLVSLLATACSTNTKPIELTPTAVASFSDKQTRYIQEIRMAIQWKFFIEDGYRGKTCDVTIKMSKDGLVYDLQGDGYPPLCKAAMKAIKNADIPVPYDEETYQRFQKTVLTFKPI